MSQGPGGGSGGGGAHSPLGVAHKATQAHELLTTSHEIIGDDDAVRAPRHDAHATRIAGDGTPQVAPRAHDLVGAKRLLDATPRAVELRFLCARCGQRELPGLTARQKLQTTESRFTATVPVERRIGPIPFCVRLFDEAGPEAARARALAKGWLPVRGARDPIVHQDDLPVVVRVGVLGPEAHGVEPLVCVGRIDEDALRHVDVAAHDIEGTEQPLVLQRPDLEAAALSVGQKGAVPAPGLALRWLNLAEAPP